MGRLHLDSLLQLPSRPSSSIFRSGVHAGASKYFPLKMPWDRTGRQSFWRAESETKASASDSKLERTAGNRQHHEGFPRYGP